jgi:hypothetical protein
MLRTKTEQCNPALKHDRFRVKQQQARTSFSEEKPGRPARSKKTFSNLGHGRWYSQSPWPRFKKKFLRRFLQKAASF